MNEKELLEMPLHTIKQVVLKYENNNEPNEDIQILRREIDIAIKESKN